MTKFLQVGPFSVLTSEGALNGICKCRFFLAFLAVMTSMVTKALFIASFFYSVSGDSFGRNINNSVIKALGASEETEALMKMLLLLVGLLILPNFLFSLISIGCSTGFNRKLPKVILAYPAAWMLPIATYFVIGPQNLSCCSKTNTHKYHLGFSKPYTIINIILTVIMYAFIISYFNAFRKYVLIMMVTYWSPVLFGSLVFNIAFMLSDLKCSCSCCCNNDCREHETSVIDTNTEKLDIVKIED